MNDRKNVVLLSTMHLAALAVAADEDTMVKMKSRA